MSFLTPILGNSIRAEAPFRAGQGSARAAAPFRAGQERTIAAAKFRAEQGAATDETKEILER